MTSKMRSRSASFSSSYFRRGKDVDEFIYHLTWPPWLEEAGKLNEREGGEKKGESEGKGKGKRMRKRETE